MNKNKYILTTLSIILGLLIQNVSLTLNVSAIQVQGWDAGYIIADGIFTDNRSMNVAQIQAFLDSKVPVCDNWGTNGSTPTSRRDYVLSKGYALPMTCLKEYTENGLTAAQIIYDVSQQYQINPQVLIVLLQKEQGLVTDDWPTEQQYRSATGYGCPDTAPCDSQYYGLTNQINWSAHMFRAILNNSPTWWSPYVLGNNNIQWSPNASCGSSVVNIQNRSTQALYDYTPYQPNQSALNAGYGTGDSCSAYGNRNFYLYFTGWFGSTRGDYCLSSLNDTSTGIDFKKIQKSSPDAGEFMIYSGSSTSCVEFHTWSQGLANWQNHTASNSSNINLTDSSIQYADLNGDGKDEAILIGLKGTASGKIEFHIWNDDLRSWKDHYISNAATIDPTVSQVSFADLDGDGKDEGILTSLTSSVSGSGNIEMHVWNQGFGSWKDHYISNAATIDPTVSQVSFADLDGDGKDEGILTSLTSSVSGSGNIEMHVWNQGFGSWKDHYISNAATIDPTVSQVSFADLDGDGKDEGILIALASTVSGSGNIEMHIWNPGFGSWRTHYITNQLAKSVPIPPQL